MPSEPTSAQSLTLPGAEPPTSVISASDLSVATCVQATPGPPDSSSAETRVPPASLIPAKKILTKEEETYRVWSEKLEAIRGYDFFPDLAAQVKGYLSGKGQRVQPELADAVNECLLKRRQLIDVIKILLMQKKRQV